MIACFGELLADRFEGVEQPGGAPANVACALGRWGVQVGLVCAVGRDPRGDRLLSVVDGHGVDLSTVQRVDAPTRVVEVVLDDRGDRSFGGFGAPTESFADTRVDVAKLSPLAVSHLVCGTIPLATCASAEALLKAVIDARARGAEIVLDVNWRPMFWPDPSVARREIGRLLPLVDWLKVSREEADWLGRLPDCRGVFITDGERGCTWRIAEQQGEHAAFDVPVRDTTGAGDAFVAGVVLGLVERTPAAELVRWACAAGALTCTRTGAIAGVPSRAEVNALARNGRTTSVQA